MMMTFGVYDGFCGYLVEDAPAVCQVPLRVSQGAENINKWMEEGGPVASK